ncbi:MAG: PIN domain-containing protein [Candidatus Eremiobacteraeota bacterium]|nr:PIN domain-containing protein [Candidatus Eremiobacteraeota bacterium]
MSIMVDTSAWYAIVDKDDTNHEKAGEFFRDSLKNADLVITDLILSESWFLISRGLGRGKRFLLLW